MAPTHAIAGASLALPLLAVAPEFAGVAAIAGLLGGLAPDFDLYVGHRQTLHYPVYGSGLSVVALSLAAVLPTILTVSGAVFLTAAALHAVSDAFGGGLELRPWEATSTRAVYDHYNDQWLIPRRLIRYDGAPEDLLVAGVLAGGVIAGFGITSVVGMSVLVLVALGTVYVLFRKPLAAIAAWLFPQLPCSIHPYLPDRYLQATD